MSVSRLAVRERNDDVGAHGNVRENGLGRRCSSGHSDDHILPGSSTTIRCNRPAITGDSEECPVVSFGERVVRS